MEKEKITLTIGSTKALVFEADPDDKQDQDFVKLCKAVAESQPQSIQDFFIRLSDMEQNKSVEAHRKVGRKM